GIQELIVKRTRESRAAFEQVLGFAERQLRLARKDADDLAGGIQRRALETVTAARVEVQKQLTAVQHSAQQSLHEAAQDTLQALSDVRAGASGRLASARA